MTDSETRARVDRRLGTTLRGKYVLEAVIGVGGMAAVYRARHRNGSRVAIKMLHLQYSFDEEMRTRFVREGYIANGVDHPGVVRAIDDDVAEDGAVFVVMELLEGETVHARFERAGGRLPPGDVVRLTLDLLDVLVAAHARTIVHRDLKPENLFVTREGALKVLDFGIARWQEAHGSLTQSGMTMGTPAFMAPEQALGKRDQIDGRSDLWSVGATMFTLLSGRYVHVGESFQELAVLAATKPAPPLRTVSPQTPAPLAAVVDRALAMSKHDRWPSAQAMKRALEDAWTLCRLGPVVRASAPPPPSEELDETREQRRAGEPPSGVEVDSDEETRELAKPPPLVADAPPVEPASGSPAGGVVHSTTAGFSSRRLLEPNARGRSRRRLAVVAMLVAPALAVVVWIATRSTPRDEARPAAENVGTPTRLPSSSVAATSATAAKVATESSREPSSAIGSEKLGAAKPVEPPPRPSASSSKPSPRPPTKPKLGPAPSPATASSDIFAP